MADENKSTIDTFLEYISNISLDPLSAPGTNTWQQKTKTVLARFADTVVGIAASSLINKDTNIKAMTNEELANAMQRHVTFRSGGSTEAKLPNSAWSMMLEAASRLKGDK